MNDFFYNNQVCYKHFLFQIDPSELANIITTNKIRFSNAPLVWLKEVAAFLNSKIQIDVDDPTFSSYPPLYPLSSAPEEIRKSLADVLQDAGKANAQLFFDVTLTSLANDMSRGLYFFYYAFLIFYFHFVSEFHGCWFCYITILRFTKRCTKKYYVGHQYCTFLF